MSTRHGTPAALRPRWGALLVVTSLGCPQLLDDDFVTLPEQAGGGDAGSASNGGAENTSGASGAGSSGGGGKTSSGNGGADNGGSSGTDAAPDASTSGAAGGDAGSDPAPEAGPPDPQTPLGFLIHHRYSFDGSGTTVIDSVGGADGEARGGAQIVDGSGKITLSGDGQYVNLPNGLLSRLDSATIEAWVKWTGDPDPQVSSSTWQTLFSFGNNSAGEDAQSQSPTTHASFTPKANDSFDARATFSLTGELDELIADGPAALPAATDPVNGTHVAVVLDSAAGVVRLFIDGVSAATSSAGNIDLEALDDVNNWIGRSQHSLDPEFPGDVLEFRIYGAALGADEVSLSMSLGPDAAL